MEGNKRIIGFDLARSFAIFGMYVVNFNIVFGSHKDASTLGKFLSLFNGNSSTVFVMLAGMGVALMTNRASYTIEEKSKLRSTINKRAWFLFFLGVLLMLWWPADILHFYGGYLHIAAFLLFTNKRYYLIASALAILAFHTLFLLIPYETGWNFETLQYKDLWTLKGFIRNTFYNGWNSIFPWLAYFTFGMYLGRLDWSLPRTQYKVFAIGLLLFATITFLQYASNYLSISEEMEFFINADYLPPFLPFVISTLGCGLMIIASFMYVSRFLSRSNFAMDLAKTGQMTLTHYISHLTIGMIVFSLITGKALEGKLNDQIIVHPFKILLFALFYYIFSFFFSKYWAKKFKNGPFELLMRKTTE